MVTIENSSLGLFGRKFFSSPQSSLHAFAFTFTLSINGQLCLKETEESMIRAINRRKNIIENMKKNKLLIFLYITY